MNSPPRHEGQEEAMPAERRFQPLPREVEQYATMVVDAALTVHRALGPGLLESAYEACLCRELELRQIPYDRQVAIPLEYAGKLVECGYRVDVLVADSIILELKAMEQLLPIHEAQLLTYMKLAQKRLGFVIISTRHY